MTRFYSHGKLLLSGEYLILDGAVGLALPTIHGQDLVVVENQSKILRWVSVDELDKIWFSADFDLDSFDLISVTGEKSVGIQLQKILRTARHMNSRFLLAGQGYEVRTALEFSRDWGLGSSSTLINNIARWADRNPFELLSNSFGGSGYDIACANSEKPLFYRLEGNKPKALQIDFDPPFANNLFFIHLNRKQTSSDSIETYNEVKDIDDQTIDHISAIGKELSRCSNLLDFQLLIKEHERIIGKAIGELPIQESIFSDFKGQIKSLGAWGGDFILAASKDNPTEYFNKKGYSTVISYSDLIL